MRPQELWDHPGADYTVMLPGWTARGCHLVWDLDGAQAGPGSKAGDPNCMSEATRFSGGRGNARTGHRPGSDPGRGAWAVRDLGDSAYPSASGRSPETAISSTYHTGCSEHRISKDR